MGQYKTDNKILILTNVVAVNESHTSKLFSFADRKIGPIDVLAYNIPLCYTVRAVCKGIGILHGRVLQNMEIFQASFYTV
jgi:hypothetical protein